GKMTGFLRMEDGTLLVAGLIGQTPALYRSDVAGATFAPVAAPPHIRGMAERAGVLYAATSNWDDGFAMATSIDGGTTWQRGLAFSDIGAIDACNKSACQMACGTLVADGVWPAAFCQADLPPTSDLDGGARPSDATASHGSIQFARGSGCACALALDRGGGGAARAATATGALALALALAGVWRR